MDQPGIEVRPIEQITGTSEFNEVFFDDAECDAEDIVGAPGDGWKVAMGLLGFERGVSTLGQQMQFQNEFDQVVALARENGAGAGPGDSPAHCPCARGTENHALQRHAYAVRPERL